MFYGKCSDKLNIYNSHFKTGITKNILKDLVTNFAKEATKLKICLDCVDDLC